MAGKSEIMSGEGSISASREGPAIDKEKEVYVQKSVTNECDTKEVSSKHTESFCERDTDLDAALEEAAKRRHLTALNVKSIIHVSSSFNTWLSCKAYLDWRSGVIEIGSTIIQSIDYKYGWLDPNTPYI